MFLFWKILLTEFIAEMGDKTQLMLIAMTSRFRMKDIILGTAAAVMVLNGLAVLAGGLVSTFIPTWLIRFAAALAFLYFAATSISGEEEEEEEGNGKTGRVAILTVFTTFFAAELGDKTQLTAITFGANEGIGNALIVWAACSIGLFASDILGMLAGYFLKSRMPERFLHLLAFVIFAVFGLVTLYQGLLLYFGEDTRTALTGTAAAAILFAVVCAALHMRGKRTEREKAKKEDKHVF